MIAVNDFNDTSGADDADDTGDDAPFDAFFAKRRSLCMIDAIQRKECYPVPASRKLPKQAFIVVVVGGENFT